MTRSRALLLLAALLFLCNVWGYDLWAPDEPYFGEGAREMVVDGHWAVPHVNGVVTTDKPPLFFWSIAFFSLPFGKVLSLTARLPSILAALGALALTLRLGRRLFGERAALWATFALATSYLFWDKARTAQIDALLCFLVLAALSAFEAFRAGDARGRPAGLLFWLAAALAVLAKGPVGFLIPLGIALVTLAVDRRFSTWKRFAPLSGPALFLGVIALWGVSATVFGDGDYTVWGAFKEHVLDRAVHGMHHAQPPWYYLTVLPVQLLPWTGLVPAALLLAWRRRGAGTRFLLVWCLFVVVFFSVSTEKRDLYVLPAYPAFALLIGAAAAWLVENPGGAARRDVRLHAAWFYVPQALAGAALVLAGAALPFAGGQFELVPLAARAALGAAFGIGGLATLGALIARKRFLAALSPALGTLLVYLIAATVIFPALNPVKSVRSFAERVRERTEQASAGGELLAYRLGNLPEALAFYGDGLYTRETTDPAELARHMTRGTAAYAVVDRAGLDALDEDLRRAIVVLDEAKLARRRVALIANGR